MSTTPLPPAFPDRSGRSGVRQSRRQSDRLRTLPERNSDRPPVTHGRSPTIRSPSSFDSNHSGATVVSKVPPVPFSTTSTPALRYVARRSTLRLPSPVTSSGSVRVHSSPGARVPTRIGKVPRAKSSWSSAWVATSGRT